MFGDFFGSKAVGSEKGPDSQFVQSATAASTSGDHPILPDAAAEDSIPAVPSAANWEEAEQVSPETLSWAHTFVKSAGSIARAGHILELLAQHQEDESDKRNDAHPVAR